MISVNLFTSGKHTQPLIKVLRKSTEIKLFNVYEKIERPQKADVFIIADFGEIVTSKIINLPQYGTLGIHPSLLPKYRGASPVPFAILNNEKKTGVTIFKVDEKMDHGPVICQLTEPIKPTDDQETLLARLFQKGGEALIKILPDYLEGKIKLIKQNHRQATYASRLSREDGRIDWKKTDAEIERFIRAMHSWPGAWTLLRLRRWRGKRFKILKAHLEKEKLIFDLVQLEGKKPITGEQFSAGYPDWKPVSLLPLS